MNGFASPSHLAANSYGAKQGEDLKFSCFFCFVSTDPSPDRSGVEGYMKTDDRMRLAKERREERERSLGRKRLWVPLKFIPNQTQSERVTFHGYCRGFALLKRFIVSFLDGIRWYVTVSNESAEVGLKIILQLQEDKNLH